LIIGSIRRLLETISLSKFKPGAHARMNAAKEQALHEMSNEVERAIAEYREDCQTDLTSRTFIRTYVDAATNGKFNDAQITHAISHAGMQSTGKRVKLGKSLHSVIIVRGDLTPDIVKRTSAEVLIKIIEKEKEPIYTF
jgi:hypothetical protein